MKRILTIGLLLTLSVAGHAVTQLDSWADLRQHPANLLFTRVETENGVTVLTIGLAERAERAGDFLIEINGDSRLLLDGAGLPLNPDRNAPLTEWLYNGSQLRVELPATDPNAVTVRTLSADGHLLDECERGPERDTHHVAFVHHGNQGLTWSDVFYGTDEDGVNQHWSDYTNVASPYNGFDEIIGLHDVLDEPVNLHLAGQLQTAAEWYYPSATGFEGFNDWMARGAAEGWAGMITSAYAQHIMPFVSDEMNDWAVHVETDMVEERYGYTPHVAWVPERVWVSPEDNDGNGIDASFAVEDWIGDNWIPHGVYGVLLDQDIHCNYKNNALEDRHIYTISTPDGDLQILPMDNTFVGHVNWDVGAAWDDIINSSSDELIIYGNDWEVTAEVAGHGDVNGSYLNNYIWLLLNIHGAGTAVDCMKLDNALGSFSGGSINLINGTYGSLGAFYGYGANWSGGWPSNSWYPVWASTPSHSDFHDPVRDYGTIWTTVRDQLLAAPDNDVSQSGWYVMMTNLYETGWQESGEVAGWEHRYSSHIKNAAVYAEASHWANGEYAETTAAYLSDIDIDGVDELVIHNDRVFAVIESIGGKLEQMFARGDGYAYSVIGNDNAYWVETDGDYNENSNNHVASLSDVSPYYENDLYTLSVDFDSTNSAQVRMSFGAITKTVRVDSGNPWLQIGYDASDHTTYLQNAGTPDMVDIIWNANLERVWDPDIAYVGHRNPWTGASLITVMGNGGLSHNFEFTGTTLKGDEFIGQDRFGFLLWGGYTTEPVAGEIAELETLAAQNLDFFPPRVIDQALFLNSSELLVRFDEALLAGSAEVPGNYLISGLSQGTTVTAAELQGNQSEVILSVTPPLPSGETGHVTVSNVSDTQGNVVTAPDNSASFFVPSGLTPHTIVIDGVNDFDQTAELIDLCGDDSLFVTWDHDALYIAVKDQVLTAADLFVNIDTDQLNGSGAASGSWGRVNFTNPHRIEYQIAVEGGGNSMQINRWSGTSWIYQQYGDHDGVSYEGWSGNSMTELSIPWSELGDPDGIAFTVHLTQEDNWTTTCAWPVENPTGSGITFTDYFQLYEPYIEGPMPLDGFLPASLTEEILMPVVLSISITDEQVVLEWPVVAQATFYQIYRSDSPYMDIATMSPWATVTESSFSEVVDGSKQFYIVIAGN